MRNEYDFSKGKRGSVIPPDPNQVGITLYLNADIIDYFKEIVDKSGGGNYQLLINKALHEYIEQQNKSLEQLLEITLRRVIREELPMAGNPAKSMIKERA